jgi:Family of unknown function (DUF6527)
LKKLFQKATAAIRRGLVWWKYRHRIHSIAVDEMPDTLIPRRLYLIGSNGMPWSAAILCPCGCGEAIQLSLLIDDSPSWTLSADRHDLPILSPSVWRTKGCRSHFFLRHGMIEWCRNDNEQPHNH